MTILRTVRLSIVSALALSAVAMVAASIAAAAPPTIERTLVEVTFLDEVDCAFPVEVYINGTDTMITSTVQGEVREFHAFGGGYTTLTNLSTEESITFNISGPTHSTFRQDGSFSFVGTGTSIFLFEDTPGIQWFKGRFVLSIDPQGNETFTTDGTFVDMCAALDPGLS